MDKQVLSFRQVVCFIVSFIIGSSVVLGGSSDAGQDSWLCVILSQAFTLPILFIFARIIKLFPGKNLYEITDILFGKIIGKIFDIFYIWYSIHLAAIVLRNFSEFIEIVAMPETPQLSIVLIILLVVAYLAKSSVKTLGKWSIIVLVTVISVLITTIALLANQLNLENFLPIMNHSTKVVLSGSYNLLAFPFAETVLFLTIADFLNTKDSPYKMYFIGEILGAFVLLLVICRNIAAIGPEMMKAEYFPSYIAARIISVSDFLARIEGTISANFVLGGITKIALCLIAASRGLANLFKIQDYKKIILPVSLAAAALSCTLFASTMEMVNFIKVYVIYAVPFQIILPVIIWSAGEIKTRFNKKLVPNS